MFNYKRPIMWSLNLLAQIGLALLGLAGFLLLMTLLMKGIVSIFENTGSTGIEFVYLIVGFAFFVTSIIYGYFVTRGQKYGHDFRITTDENDVRSLLHSVNGLKNEISNVSSKWIVPHLGNFVVAIAAVIAAVVGSISLSVINEAQIDRIEEATIRELKQSIANIYGESIPKDIEYFVKSEKAILERKLEVLARENRELAHKLDEEKMENSSIIEELERTRKDVNKLTGENFNLRTEVCEIRSFSKDLEELCYW